MAEKKLSEMPEVTVFPVDGKVYGVASGVPGGAFTRDAFLDLVLRSEAGRNKFVVFNAPTRSGQILTYPSGSSWYILGSLYGNSSNNVVSVPYAASGKTRIDLIVVNTSNQFVRVPGVEVTDPSSPASPPQPINTLLAGTVLVGDSAVDIQLDVSKPIYIGLFATEGELFGNAARPHVGYFGFVVNATTNSLYQYDGADWIITNLLPKSNGQIEIVVGNRAFVVGDKGKHLYAIPSDIDAPVSLLMSYDFASLNGDEINVTALEANCYINSDSPFYSYKNEEVSIIEIQKNSTARIKYDGVFWRVTIMSDELVPFRMHISQSGGDEPVILPGSLGLGFAVPTSSYDSAGEYTITFDLPILENVLDKYKKTVLFDYNLLVDPTGPAVVAWYFYVEDDYTLKIKSVDGIGGSFVDDVLIEPMLIEMYYKP
jgi:hypothetical protein